MTPTPEQNAATANVMKNIAELLKHGMFFGHNAGYVHEALGWLDRMVAELSPKVEEAPKKPRMVKRKAADG